MASGKLYDTWTFVWSIQFHMVAAPSELFLKLVQLIIVALLTSGVDRADENISAVLKNLAFQTNRIDSTPKQKQKVFLLLMHRSASAFSFPAASDSLMTRGISYLENIPEIGILEGYSLLRWKNNLGTKGASTRVAADEGVDNADPNRTFSLSPAFCESQKK